MEYNYFTESSKDFKETETIGTFTEGVIEYDDFNSRFESVYDTLKSRESIDIMGGINNRLLSRNESFMEEYQDEILKPLKNDCTQILESQEREAGLTYGMGSLYDVTKGLWDNCMNDHILESTNLGQLLPIKSIDYPLLYRANVATCSNLIMQTESTPSPIIRKRIEQEYMYDPKTNERWAYPQCVFDREAMRDIIGRSTGIRFKQDKIELGTDGLYNYNIIENLTDVAVPSIEDLSLDIRITKVYFGEVEIILPGNGAYIALDDNQLRRGKVNVTIGGVNYNDELFGSMDPLNHTITIQNAKKSDGITHIVFDGRLANMRHDRTMRFDRDRRELEWKIPDGPLIDMPLYMETIEDHKALMNIDLYQWTYERFSDRLNQYEDAETLDFLDDAFHRFEGIEIDPAKILDPDSSFVSSMGFDCDGGTQTLALQNDYINQMLKWKIENYLIAIADTVKLAGLTFVAYGNPRYIHLLNPAVKWVRRAGQSVGGVTLDWDYGIMTTGGTDGEGIPIQVVANKKFDYKDYPGIRFVAYPTSKNQYTFKRWKYTYHIKKGGTDNQYRAPELPGGSQTYIFGTYRMLNTMVQCIQGETRFINAGPIVDTLTGVY